MVPLSARYLVCSKEEVKEKHSTRETRKEQACTWTSCKACAQYRITRVGVWNIQKVVIDHNHHMVSHPYESHTEGARRHCQVVHGGRMPCCWPCGPHVHSRRASRHRHGQPD